MSGSAWAWAVGIGLGCGAWLFIWHGIGIRLRWVWPPTTNYAFGVASLGAATAAWLILVGDWDADWPVLAAAGVITFVSGAAVQGAHLFDRHAPLTGAAPGPRLVNASVVDEYLRPTR